MINLSPAFFLSFVSGIYSFFIIKHNGISGVSTHEYDLILMSEDNKIVITVHTFGFWEPELESQIHQLQAMYLFQFKNVLDVSYLISKMGIMIAISSHSPIEITHVKKLLAYGKCWMCVFIAQSCPTLCKPLDCSPSTEFSKQEYWSGLPFPSPGDLPNWGIKPRSATLQTDSLSFEPPGKPNAK